VKDMQRDQASGADQTTANIRAARDAELERLNSDLRVLSPLGIERAAWGWDRHAPDSSEAFHAAERAAIRAIENSPDAEEWGEWRRRLFHEVEGQLAFTAWRAEHGGHAPHVHKAERAAFAAALGVFARPWISHAQYRTLVNAMAEALPWLLPERPPAPAP
jgi:hypothetical protein